MPGIAWTVTFDTSQGRRDFVIEHTVSGNFILSAMVVDETAGIGLSTGDLALDQDGIKALMAQVVRVPRAVPAVRNDASVDQAVTKALTLPNAYVIGLVKGYDEWRAAQADQARRTFDKAAKPPAAIVDRKAPHIEHHLAVLGITRNGNYNDVDVWSWGERFTVRILLPHTGSYFYGYLYGQVA